MSRPIKSSWYKKAFKNLPVDVQKLIGRRVYFNTIADKDWIKKKREMKARGALEFNSTEGLEQYREFMKAATKAGVCRDLYGRVVGYENFESGHARPLYIEIDCEIKRKNEVDIVMVMSNRLTNVIAPTEIDLIEMMTHKTRAVREFAVTYFKEQNQVLGEVVESIFKLAPETRAMIFKKFCFECGEVRHQCTCFDYE